MTPETLSAQNETKAPSPDHHRNQSPALFPAFATAMIVGILLLIALIHIGFFNFYIKYFPKFEDANVEGFGTKHFSIVHHFHGVMMMGWVFMLLAQPILMRSGKVKLHRQVGKLSYVLAPLMILSMFLVNQYAYNSVLQVAGKAEAVSRLALIFPAIVFFAILYILAISYRNTPRLHMRFMCSTAFLFIPPALDRALIYYFHLPGYDVGSIIELSIIGAVTVFDSIKTKRLSPFALVFAFEALHTILWHSRQTELWQSVGSTIAKLF